MGNHYRTGRKTAYSGFGGRWSPPTRVTRAAVLGKKNNMPKTDKRPFETVVTERGILQFVGNFYGGYGGPSKNNEPFPGRGFKRRLLG